MVQPIGHEKPWYYPAIVALLRDDIPVDLDYSTVEIDRDVHTLDHRLSCEGESFLTKTLPAFGKSIDLALQGNVPLSQSFFKRKSKSCALPAFLWGLLRRVFLETGWIREEPCIRSIRLLRQICFWCKKIEKGFTDESVTKAIEDFISVDGSLPDRDTLPRNGILGTARAVVHGLIGKTNKCRELRPKHGPGSVAGGGNAVDKRLSRISYTFLEKMFKPYRYFFALRDIAEDYKRITKRPREYAGFSKLQFVEKDSSGPRTIGLEPAEYMWCQQAVKGWLYHHVENHRLTKGHVNFTDQSINQRLTSQWATVDTLDMSKASDRNSLALVEALFEGTWLWPYLQACRTPGTVLPNGKLLWFKKFAPMGSAVCFPVEAITFFALAVGTLHHAGFSLFSALRNVYVYGDDLIVPHGFYDVLCQTFETFGLKFNTDKCCVHGKFRESCGSDTYAGKDVTPIRMRKIYPKRNAATLIPVVEHANSLAKAGYWGASSALRKAFYLAYPTFRRLKIPLTHRTDYPFLTWIVSIDHPETKLRVKTRNSIFFVRGWGYVSERIRSTVASEELFLLESLSQEGPVGMLRSPSKEQSRTDGRLENPRVFDHKYRGSLKLKRFAIQPGVREAVIPSCWLP